MLVYILHATLSIHLTLGGGRENPEGEDICTCIGVKSLQSCLTLCDTMDSSPTCSSVHGILQARILEWVSMPFSRESTHLSCLLHRQVDFCHYHCLGRPTYVSVHFSSVTQSCPTLCNPVNHSTQASLSITNFLHTYG